MDELLEAFYKRVPDADEAGERVVFGTSGHRGSSLKTSFNEQHILAIAQSVADYRTQNDITGPLFLGRDTHALSLPAWEVALQVLVANGVEVRVSANDVVTATPLVSRAILAFNQGKTFGLADGLIITPSHNPPEDGGIKYNTPDGGPADTAVTTWIEKRANMYLERDCATVQKVPLFKAKKQAQAYDYVSNYVAELSQVVDMQVIAQSSLKLGADPMGGTALPVWQALKEAGLNLEIVNESIDSSFAFMPPDHDGRIRMDCSSAAAMANLLKVKDQFALAFGNDPDADRHGIVDEAGLMNPNHYLCVAVDYLLKNRPQWNAKLKVGKTLVTSSLMDKVVAANNRQLFEVPVGFKWFVHGLHLGELAFGGEESAGASFLTFNGSAWSTDKDGILLCLLAAEITAKTGLTPSAYYAKLTAQLGAPFYKRVDTPCSGEQKAAFKALSRDSVTAKELAGHAITDIFTHAPGNLAGIGGIKVVTEQGWFAARPSGTEDIYKVYAESFVSQEHLQALIDGANGLLKNVLV
ncbi:MAG: phosphoglucomutase, alpha-D-glucose phosphate-specific [Venatoribacter sp.]